MTSEPLWQVLILVVLGMTAAQAFVLVAVMRHLGGLMVQLNPARIGEVDAGPDVDSIVHVPGANGRPAVVLFVSPDCALCHMLRPSIPAVAEHYPELALLPVVLGEGADARREYARALGANARPDMPELAIEWDVPGTPFGVGVDGTGRVRARGVVNTLDHLESLAETVVRLHARDVLGVVEDSAAAQGASSAESRNGHEHGATDGAPGDGEPTPEVAEQREEVRT